MNINGRKLHAAGVAVLIALAVTAAGCGSSGTKARSGGTPVKGGTATVAEAPGEHPSWIWPFAPITNYSVYNSQQFQWLMYRPLYLFGNNGDAMTVNYPLSLASTPVYSGTTVTISLKSWKWSDGEAVSAKDVIFWLNMESAEKASYAGYVPGTMPDNLVSYTATGPNQVTLTLNKPYSRYWYTYNQLSEITPMPMAWDVTRLGAAAGSGGCTTDSSADKWARCKAVFSFLTAQSKATSTYATSPLWSVVDGPFKLSSFTTDGNDTLVPNAGYSGSPKPAISELRLVSFTSDSSEYNALKAGRIDAGYIPYADLPQRTGTAATPATSPLGSAYNLQSAFGDGIFYYIPNFDNPALGAVFRQLYVRQALQDTVDQAGIGKAIYRGYSYPTSGPVPTKPPNQWVPPAQNAHGGAGPDPFSIARATSLLTGHGWREVGGVMSCQIPARCGPGISKGQELKFTLDYSSQPQFTQEAAFYKSDASKAGIDITVVGQAFNTIIDESAPCKPGPKCTWGALMYGAWNFGGPGFEPTGEALYQTGASSNSGSYSSPTMDRLIGQTHTISSLAAFRQYAAFGAQQLPFIWMPANYVVQAVSSKLHRVTYNPFGDLLPEYWYFTR